MTELATKQELHEQVLKKIRTAVGRGQTILQVSDKHEQITEMFADDNILTRVSSLSELGEPSKKQKYCFVIADLDSPELDDFEAFLDKVQSLIIEPGFLIVLGTNLCTLKNKLLFLLDKAPRDFPRPLRSVPDSFLRDTLIRKKFLVKNRYWVYKDKFVIMANIPGAQ